MNEWIAWLSIQESRVKPASHLFISYSTQIIIIDTVIIVKQTVLLFWRANQLNALGFSFLETHLTELDSFTLF